MDENPWTSSPGPVLDNAVLMLFAHQQLVFRYPLTNPFEVMPYASSTSEGAGSPEPIGNLGAPDAALPGAAPQAQGLPPKMPTCVGLESSTMMFLLRNSYARLTTIRIGVCSLLIWPLFGVKGEAMLVVALGQPDDSYAHVCRFMQVCVNVLLREEARCSYVTRAVDGMLAAIEAAGGSTGGRSAAPAAEDIAPRKPRSGCNDAATPSPTVALPSTGVGVLDVMNRAAHAAQGIFVELRQVAETINGQFHQDIQIHHLMVLPHSHMSGHVRHRRQVVASFSSRFPPGSVITIADPAFVESRRQQYQHVAGRDLSELLPLDDILREVRRLPAPWTLFSVRSALERFLIMRMESHRRSAAGRNGGASGGEDLPDSGGTSPFSVRDAPFIVFEVLEFLRLFGAVMFHIQRLAFTRGRLSNSSSRVPPHNDGPGTCGGNEAARPTPPHLFCILGPTCLDCEMGRNPFSQQPPLSKETTEPSLSTEVQHQLLYLHYNGVYDDPWFVASEVEHRAFEASLVLGDNRHPSVRVYERMYEGPAALAQRTTQSNTMQGMFQLVSPVNSGIPLTSRVAAATHVEGQAAPPDHHTTSGTPCCDEQGSCRTQLVGLQRAADVPLAASAWLHRHTEEIHRRVVDWMQTESGASTSTANTAVDAVPPPMCSAVSTPQSGGGFGIDSLNSLTRRRCFEPPRKDAAGRTVFAGTTGPRTTAPESAASRMPDETGMLPDETLLQLVVHIVVVLLWQAGEEWSAVASRTSPFRGSSSSASPFPAMDELTAKIEWSLRHIAPTLRNMDYVTMRVSAIQTHAEEKGDVASSPPPLSPAERKILDQVDALGALHMLSVMKAHAGREIRRIPCRWLVHAAVNVLSDVVSVVLVPSKLPSAAAI